MALMLARFAVLPGMNRMSPGQELKSLPPMTFFWDLHSAIAVLRQSQNF